MVNFSYKFHLFSEGHKILKNLLNIYLSITLWEIRQQLLGWKSSWGWLCNRYFIKRSKEFYLRLIGRELFLWLEGDEGPWFESDDELLLLLFKSGLFPDKSGLFPDKSGFSGWSQICSSDGVGDVCLLLFEFSTEGFDEIFSEILLPAKLSPEVALPETEAPETEEAEAEAGWRFSTFSWAADKRFFREMGLG